MHWGQPTGIMKGGGARGWGKCESQKGLGRQENGKMEACRFKKANQNRS